MDLASVVCSVHPSTVWWQNSKGPGSLNLLYIATEFSRNPDHTLRGAAVIILSCFIYMYMYGELTVSGMSRKGGYSHSALVYALRECNYRLIDTAVRYNNETKIGLAVKVRTYVREGGKEGRVRDRGGSM